MKKDYEKLEIEVFFMQSQDVITSSVYVEWGDDWKGDGNQNNDSWVGNIFG